MRTAEVNGQPMARHEIAALYSRQIAEMTAQGYSDREMGDALGISWQAVGQIRRVVLGISKKSGQLSMRERKTRDERKQKIVEMMREGYNLEQMGIKLDVSRQRVEQIVRQHQLTPPAGSRIGVRIQRGPEADAILAPFFDYVGGDPHCLLCKQQYKVAPGKKKHIGVCRECREVAKRIQWLRYHIGMLKDPSLQRYARYFHRGQALSLIRRWHLQPTDLLMF